MDISHQVYKKAGMDLFIDESLVHYHFRINEEEKCVVEFSDSPHSIVLNRLFVVVDCVWDADRGIQDFIVWNPEQIPLSNFANGGYIVGVNILTPDSWIYRESALLYDVCGNQAKADEKHSIGVGTILILDELNFNDCLNLGVLSAKGEFDSIIEQAVTESGGTLWY